MKNNLRQFIEGQTQFSTSWDAQMSLTLNEPIENVLCSNLQACTKNLPNMEGVGWKTTNPLPKVIIACKVRNQAFIYQPTRSIGFFFGLLQPLNLLIDLSSSFKI